MRNLFRNDQALAQIKASISLRWGLAEREITLRLWPRPAKVRILLYADGSALFQGGPFLGLSYVRTLLESRPYYYVDFDVATAHRDGADPTASISGARQLTELDIMNQFDEIWFFGVTSQPRLTGAEVALLDQFMSAPKFGGVLVTGDHADLGRGIAGQIPRAGRMRQYPAPDAIAPGWNTTLEDGPDPEASFDFDDQSDDTPQRIRFKRYRVTAGPVYRYLRRQRPHQILCGPNGPVDVFPDHQHEGEAVAPVPAPNDPEWPTKAGHQEGPEVIAWGRIKDPSADKHGQEIGLVSVYDGHDVDVGRIVADSTWHHWFDINLTGVVPEREYYKGFDATAAGQAVLTKIDAYFLNCGVWLAPVARQQAMRRAAWWAIIWSDIAVQASPRDSVLALGRQAIDALGRYAPQCTVWDWILEPIFKPKIPRWEWPMFRDRFELVDLPFEAFVAGGVFRQLAVDLGPFNSKNSLTTVMPEDEELDRAIEQGVADGLAAFARQLQAETSLASRLVENDFRLSAEFHEAIKSPCAAAAE